MTASNSLKMALLTCAVLLAFVADMFPGCGSSRPNPANTPQNKPANAAAELKPNSGQRIW